MEKVELDTEAKIDKIKKICRKIREDIKVATSLIEELGKEECQEEVSEVKYLRKLNYQIKNHVEKNEDKLNLLLDKEKDREEKKKKKEELKKRHEEMSKIKSKAKDASTMTTEIIKEEEEVFEVGDDERVMTYFKKCLSENGCVEQPEGSYDGSAKLALIDYENLTLFFDERFSFLNFSKEKKQIRLENSSTDVIRIGEEVDKEVKSSLEKIMGNQKRIENKLESLKNRRGIKKVINEQSKDIQALNQFLHRSAQSMFKEAIAYSFKKPVSGKSIHTQTPGFLLPKGQSQVIEVNSERIDEYNSMKKDYKILKNFYESNKALKGKVGRERAIDISEKSKLSVSTQFTCPAHNKYKEKVLKNIKYCFRNAKANTVMVHCEGAEAFGFSKQEILESKNNPSEQGLLHFIFVECYSGDCFYCFDFYHKVLYQVEKDKTSIEWLPLTIFEVKKVKKGLKTFSGSTIVGMEEAQKIVILVKEGQIRVTDLDGKEESLIQPGSKIVAFGVLKSEVITSSENGVLGVYNVVTRNEKEPKSTVKMILPITSKEQPFSISTHETSYSSKSQSYVIIGTSAMKKIFFKIYCYKFDRKGKKLKLLSTCDLRKFKFEPTVSHSFLSSEQVNPIFVMIGKNMKKKKSTVICFDLNNSANGKIEPERRLKKEIDNLENVGILQVFGDRVIGMDIKGRTVMACFKN